MNMNMMMPNTGYAPSAYNGMPSNIPGIHTNIAPYIDQMKSENPLNNLTVIREPTSKSYYKWVANKKEGLMSRWSGKMMVPLCQRPFIGIIILIILFVFVFYITKYIYNFRCSIRELSDHERKTITDSMLQSEITKLNSIINEINNKSGFTGNNTNPSDMVHEQAMFYKFTDAEKRIYTKVSDDDRRLIFSNYLKSLQ